MTALPNSPFINGRYVSGSSADRIVLINPANETAWGEVECVSVEDLDQAVVSSEDCYRSTWRDMPPEKRAEILFALANRIRENLEALAQLESQNIGKPIADARGEVGLGARVFEYYAGAISKCFGQTIPVAGGGLDFTLRQPMGVVAAIVPWNFPFPITCWKVAPALAAGNTVVVKPASLSPVTALALGELAQQAGLPDGALQILPGQGSRIGNALVSHPLIRKVSFTGSTDVGSHIMSLAARDLKRVSLELGGKSPNIVFADADLDLAAAKSPMSVFANTGQDCCARSRVFVEASIFDAFVEKFTSATRALRVGDPASPETQIGPLVSQSQREISEAFLEEAQRENSRVVFGGDRPLDKGFYLNPAILIDVQPGQRVWKEEVFGPVVCIRPFNNEQDMLKEVNDSPYGLSGSIWTNDLKRAIRVARQVESGVLGINTNSSVHLEAPFGGFKRSGIGRDLGMQAMEGYTELKNIYIDA